MLVKELMTKEVKVVGPNSMISEAASLMRGMNCGVLPVCENDRIVGMVTDRDIVTRAIAENKNPASTPVSECMSKGVTYCFEAYIPQFERASFPRGAAGGGYA